MLCLPKPDKIKPRSYFIVRGVARYSPRRRSGGTRGELSRNAMRDSFIYNAAGVAGARTQPNAANLVYKAGYGEDHHQDIDVEHLVAGAAGLITPGDPAQRRQSRRDTKPQDGENNADAAKFDCPPARAGCPRHRKNIACSEGMQAAAGF
jgi:hypothetical protein